MGLSLLKGAVSLKHTKLANCIYVCMYLHIHVFMFCVHLCMYVCLCAYVMCMYVIIYVVVYMRVLAQKRSYLLSHGYSHIRSE